jgi:hypothetical protein
MKRLNMPHVSGGHRSTSGTIRLRPFVTISRQVGIGLPSLPQSLAEALGEQSSRDPPGWSVWDRELTEKVAADYHLPLQKIEQVEQSGYSWLDTFVSGLVGTPDDFAIVHRVRDAVRDLAAQGNVVLVGHGAVFMTSDMPGGVHVRLVAPLRYRVANFAHSLGVSIPEAAGSLQQAQRNWTEYLRTYWPTQSLAPETFAATLNTAALDEDRLVRCIVSVTA